jgi:GR25 family glycosyltransferase involved in LPS biosynthesis/glycosyltransferase involved in cell wall biosynthesis
MDESNSVQNDLNSKKTICLNMIVKNEERIIVDTLTKLLTKIRWDYWVICDTGSTDKTREVIIDFFKSVNIPGEMISHEWKDFGYNRTEALKCAFGKTDYVFIFDADDEICLDFKLPENLTADAYNFQFGNHSDYNCYTRALLVNNRQKWKYVGVLHEVIVPDGFSNSSQVISGNYFVVSGRSGDRNTNNPDKYLKDAQILEKAYYEALEKDDNLHERYAFYCGNSYCDHGDAENAIKWYKITLTHNNWCQEKYMCCLKIFNCYEKLGQKETGFYYCVKSLSHDSERAECVHQLIVHYCCENMNNVAYSYYTLIQDYIENRFLNEVSNPHNHKLFIDNSIMNFHLPYYMVIVCEKTHHYDTGIRMLEIIFTKKQKYVSDFHTRCLLFNMQFFMDRIPQEKMPDFIHKLKEYVSFLEENGYKVCEYDFMHIYEKYGLENKYISKKLEEINPEAYAECKKSNKILFYTGLAGVRWNQTYSLKNALGGSETAVAYLTKFFPKNYEIFVTGEVEEENIDNVHYVNSYNLENLLKNTNFHTIVISRYAGFFDMYPYSKSFQNFIWVHDTVINSYGSSLNDVGILQKWESRINGIVCLTQWHKEHLEHLYPSIRGKTHVINNGIKSEMFTFPFVKKPNSFIYTSCPERGLKRLLELWPSILEKFPDAELNISSYVDFPRHDGEREIQKTIDSLTNVKYLGKLGPEQLYEIMSKSEYWLYPTDWPETSCITSLEMLRSEVVCIYYPIAGLTWTMSDFGIKIERGQELDTILNLSQEKKQELRENGRVYAETCSWKNRASMWNEMMGLHVEVEETPENISLKIQELEGKIKMEDIKIKIINLEKRVDRKNAMIQRFRDSKMETYEIYEAVDGKKIVSSIELKKLFDGNDFQYRRGVLGAALSHMKLWKELIDEPETCGFYVVFEDDIELTSQFKEKLMYCIHEFLEKSMDRLYLGANSVRTINQDITNLRCRKVDGEICDGNYGYIISKSAAQKMVNHFNKTSMKRAIDYTQVYHDLLENVYFVNESVIYTSSVQHHGEHVDSDIQKDYDNIDLYTLEDTHENDELLNKYYNKFLKKEKQIGEGITLTLVE